jgi:hypothetical protein
MDFNIPKFKTDKELFDFLVENKEDIFYSKKQTFKKADGFSFYSIANKSFTNKQDDLSAKDSLTATLIINTTNLLDSHGDVHVKGIWDKSLSENSRLKHIQEHQMAFDKIIADKDDLKAYVKDFTWKQLGYNVDGKTQALVFESIIKADRNPYMFNQYAKGNVDNHSVGMRYVKMALAINDEDFEDEFKNWNKYSKNVANKEALEDTKYFWAVLEAKAIEGSAVPIGSNTITPTQSIKEIEVNITKENEKELAIKNWLSNN